MSSGLVAAARQLGAAVVLAAMVFSMQPAGTGRIEPSDVNRTLSEKAYPGRCFSLSAMIALADLLTAAAIVATLGREIDVSATEVRRLARLRLPTRPRDVVDQLIAVAGLAAFGCAVTVFRTPPAILASQNQVQLLTLAIQTIWSGVFSACFVFFAATAGAGVVSKNL